MLRETPKAVNEADAFLAEIIFTGNVDALNQRAAELPEKLVTFLTQALRESNNAQPWRMFGRTLADNRLLAAALAAFDQAIYESGHATEKALIVADKVAVERALGMSFAVSADLRLQRRLAGQPAVDEAVPELVDDDLAVVCVRNQPAAYASLLDGWTDSPLLNDPLRNPRLTKSMFLDSRYADSDGRAEDFSFFVVDAAGHAVAQVECDVLAGRHLGCREAGILVTDCGVGDELRLAAEQLAIRQLFLMAEWAGCTMVMLEASEETALSRGLAECLGQRRSKSVEVLSAWIDLSLSPEEIERGYRDAHRQSLRWGRKNMEVRSTKTGLTDTQAVELYFQTYAGVGRRPGLSREQLDYLLSSRQINFYAGYFEGEARSMLISARHGTTTYYMAAVKVPVGNKPLSHRLLHEAVLDAQAEGQKRFDFGVLHTDDSWNPKLRSIALYKRGYTRSFERRRLYWVAV